MANDKYVFASNIGSGKAIAPSGTLLTDGWDPEDGTQVPEGPNMNFMHRQLSMSNDFWREVPVDLKSNTYFVIDEAKTSIASNESYPAESLIFNVVDRGGTVSSNFIDIGGPSGSFASWPIGRAFWIRNAMNDRAVFVQMPNIAANAPLIPSEITQIFKILVPGQYVKFRLVGSTDGETVTKSPYLRMEYDSHAVNNSQLLIGATVSSGISLLTRDVILQYYNGNSYCAFSSLFVDFPTSGNSASGATVRFLQNYNCNSTTLNWPNNTPGNSNWPALLWTSQFGPRPGGVDQGGMSLKSTRWIYFTIGNPSSTSVSGLVNMRLPNPPNLWASRGALPDLATTPRIVNQVTSIVGGASNIGDNGATTDTWTGSGFVDGGSICGYAGTGNLIGNIMAIGASVADANTPPAGRYIVNSYLIYPDLATATATTAGYF